MIRYQHGAITVLDRVGLEDTACECYWVVVNEYRHLLGIDPCVVAAEHLPLRSIPVSLPAVRRARVCDEEKEQAL